MNEHKSFSETPLSTDAVAFDAASDTGDLNDSENPRVSPLRRGIALSIAGGIVMQLAACGTILYPERKGQVDGQLDVGVVALDAIGLLFFLIPGVIAFAVDFSNGTIYLPGGGVADASPEEIKIEGELTDAKIEQAIKEHSGLNVSMKDDKMVKRKAATSSSLNYQVRYL